MLKLQKFWKFLLAALLAVVVSGPILPSAATAFPVISGRLQDSTGKPLANVQISAESPGLYTETCTNSDGSYKLQAKANQASVRIGVSGGVFRGGDLPRGCVEGTKVTWQISGNTTITTQAENLTFNIVTPKARQLRVTVLDDAGSPVQGATIALGAFAYEGIFGEYPSRQSPWWNGEATEYFYTNELGVATVGVFDVATSQEYIDFYCTRYEDVCQPGAPHNWSDAGSLFYSPRPGVLQSDRVIIDWTSATASLVVPSVPSLSIAGPSYAKVGDTVTLTSTAAISTTFSANVQANSVKSKFKGKKSSLYSRPFSNPLRPGAWKRLGTCTFDTYGKCKIKIKMTGTSQVQFRAVDFSATLKSKVIKKKS